MQLAIVGKQPWELLRELIDEEHYTMELLAKYTGVSQATISSYARNTSTAEGLINKNFVKLLEIGFGKDIKIELVPVPTHRMPGGLRARMNMAEQTEYNIKKVVRRMKEQNEDYRNYLRRLNYEAKKLKDDPNCFIDKDFEMEKEERGRYILEHMKDTGRPSGKDDKPDEEFVFDPEYKKEMERRERNRLAVQACRERKRIEGKDYVPRKPGRKPKNNNR